MSLVTWFNGKRKLASGIEAASLPVKELLLEHFRVGGVPSGTDNLAIDGSVTPVDFSISSHATKDKYVSHIDLYAIVEDDVAVSTTKFLNIPALTNGLAFEFKTDDVIYTPIPPIKRTEHMLSHFAHGSNYIWEEELNFTFIKVSMDLKSHPIVIRSQSEGFSVNDYLKVTVRDDLSDPNIKEMEAYIKGYYV